MTEAKPKVAFIGTGGTISSLGTGPLDILDYGATGNRMQADAIVAMFPDCADAADVIPVPFDNIPSHNIYFPAWKQLAALCDRVVAEHPGLAGIVIGHGTASMEETAYFLNLVLRVSVPVVIVGSQRPASSLSTDAGMNLVNAIRTAACPQARGMGVLLLLNDEIHAAREVTKTSTFRLQTFRTPDFGVLGHADGDKVVFYRAPLRRHAPDTEFDITALEALPRVDIVYAYVGSDGTAVRAFVAAGARGIVSAGFAPGFAQGRAVAAIGFKNPLDDFLAPLVLEIDVDVGRFAPFGAEETLEQQVALHGIDRGDTEHVADRRVGRRTAALAEDAMGDGELHDPVHRQEIRRVFHVRDQGEFVPELGGDFLGYAIGIFARRTVPGQVFQNLLGGAARHGFVRILVAEFRQAEPAAIGDPAAPRYGFRIAVEQAGHVFRRFQVAVGIAFAAESGIVDGAALAYAGDHVLQDAPFRFVVEHVVGDDG